MEKVKVEICCGTACYLLGAANMMDLEDQLPADFWDNQDPAEPRSRTHTSIISLHCTIASGITISPSFSQCLSAVKR